MYVGDNNDWFLAMDRWITPLALGDASLRTGSWGVAPGWYELPPLASSAALDLNRRIQTAEYAEYAKEKRGEHIHPLRVFNSVSNPCFFRVVRVFRGSISFVQVYCPVTR
jgi:hypothetical protein